MDLNMDTKEQLRTNNSESSLLEESESIGVYDLDSEDGRLNDSNTEDFLSAEEDEQKIFKKHDFKIPSLKTSSTDFLFEESLLCNEFKSFNMSEMNKQPPEGALERAATLAEGIRTLGKSQEENWRKMHDLIVKKDHLIKQMADIMISCKTKISPSNESLDKSYSKKNLGSFRSCDSHNTTMIPEKDTNEYWDQEDSVSALGDVSVDDISEVSIDEIADSPILDVPFGYGDQDIVIENMEAKEHEGKYVCESLSENMQ